MTYIFKDYQRCCIFNFDSKFDFTNSSSKSLQQVYFNNLIKSINSILAVLKNYFKQKRLIFFFALGTASVAGIKRDLPTENKENISGISV